MRWWWWRTNRGTGRIHSRHPYWVIDRRGGEEIPMNGSRENSVFVSRMRRFYLRTYDESFGDMFATSEILHTTIAFVWILNKIVKETRPWSTREERTSFKFWTVSNGVLFGHKPKIRQSSLPSWTDQSSVIIYSIEGKKKRTTLLARDWKTCVVSLSIIA